MTEHQKQPAGSSPEWTARLRLHPTAFIAPGAVVVGDVTLGRDTSVWFNTVVRGDVARVEVGEGTNLQDGSVVHVDEGQPALVGSRVTVGHRAVIHGCVIEDDCLVGMGAIVLTGARVGTGSLLAAGALVLEGQVIPPRSVARGMPAKVVGEATETHRALIRGGSEHYVALARSYVERGFSGPHPPSEGATGLTARLRGPMSFLEWGQLLAVLAESPDWVADRLERNDEPLWRLRPAAGRWSALEVLCHLRDAEVEVWVPRLERMLTEYMPEIPDADMRGWEVARRYNERSPAGVLEEWAAARRRLLARLAPLARVDWTRVGIHAAHGPYPLAEMVRYWGDHDLAHRRQMAEALGDFA
jgi:carbonic anhydrase/acetyltransferase-like protein (isoleucine patch superfamily)